MQVANKVKPIIAAAPRWGVTDPRTRTSLRSSLIDDDTS
jgi:hypothetical protein